MNRQLSMSLLMVYGAILYNSCNIKSVFITVSKEIYKHFGDRAICRADMGLAQPGTLFRLRGWKVVTR